jgi:gamma-butyrobetaine dioxygenase
MPMWWRTRGATTWRWTDDGGPARLQADLAERGFSVCALGREARARVDQPWTFAAALLGARPAMVERQPIAAVPHGRSYASTAGETPLHSDSQRFAGRPPRLQVMLCARAARRGGATTLIDTRALLREIRDADPPLHAALRRDERRIPFVFGDVTGPTVDGLAGEAWFTHSPMPPRDELGEWLAPWLRRAPRIVLTLAPGELLVVDNHRMLHGRTAFTGARAFIRLLIWPAPDAARSPAQRRLDAVVDMLLGAAPGQLASREGAPEPDLYRWRDRALAAALAALDGDDPDG